MVPNTEDLCYLADIGGNEAFQLWRQAPGAEPVLLTDDTSRHGSMLWNDNGAQLAFRSNAANGTDQQIWLRDGRTAASNRLLVDRPGSQARRRFLGPGPVHRLVAVADASWTGCRATRDSMPVSGAATEASWCVQRSPRTRIGCVRVCIW